MSTMARRTPPTITWRDALTPLSRASRRRWALVYAVLLTGWCWTEAAEVRGDDYLPLVAVVALFVVFGMLRRGTRRVAAIDHPELDERDHEVRDRAFRLSYPILLLALVVLLVAAVVGLPDTDRPVGDGGVESGWHLSHASLFAGVAWVLLLGVFLPTGVLAWREPDALQDDGMGSALSEALRDGLLLAALAAGLAIEIVAEADGGGTLVFAAVIALLGGLARRAGGAPMMTRQRALRVAIGLALLVGIVIAVLVDTGGSGSQVMVEGGGSSTVRESP